MAREFVSRPCPTYGHRVSGIKRIENNTGTLKNLTTGLSKFLEEGGVRGGINGLRNREAKRSGLHEWNSYLGFPQRALGLRQGSGIDFYYNRQSSHWMNFTPDLQVVSPQGEPSLVFLLHLF
jgi:hypothetical protein